MLCYLFLSYFFFFCICFQQLSVLYFLFTLDLTNLDIHVMISYSSVSTEYTIFRDKVPPQNDGTRQRRPKRIGYNFGIPLFQLPQILGHSTFLWVEKFHPFT